jgi:hypothetical protein
LSCKIKWQHTGKHRSTSLQLTLPDSWTLFWFSFKDCTKASFTAYFQ